MKLNKNQYELLKLTNLLETKTKEYSNACKKLENLLPSIKDENDERLLPILKTFNSLKTEITEINKKLKEMNNA